MIEYITPIKNYKIHETGQLFKDHIIFNEKDNKYQINYDTFKYDTSKYILFKEKKNTNNFVLCEYESLKTLLRTNKHLYEIAIPNLEYRRLYMDIDCKGENNLLSYNQINNLCIDFINYVKELYNIDNVITYTIQSSIKEEIYNDFKTNQDYEKKQFNSFHIFFNLYTNNYLQLTQLFTDYKNLKRIEEVIYLDLQVYNKKYQAFRALLQSKEPQLGEEARTDILRIITPNFKYTPINLLQNFITSITKEDIYINIQLKEKITNTELLYNIKYEIDQEKQLKEYINNLKQIQYTNDKFISKTNYWFINLILIINVLKLSNNLNDIIENECMKLFLTNSIKHKDYKNNSIDNHNKNVDFTERQIKKKDLPQIQNKDFFIGLTSRECELIYSKLNIETTKEIKCKFKLINNIRYILLEYEKPEQYTPEQDTPEEEETPEEQAIETINILKNEYQIIEEHITLYEPIKNELLINCNILKHKNKFQIQPEEQYNLNLLEIVNNNNIKFNDNEFIPFTDWSETPTNILENAFYEAPVGSRKTSGRMDKDIKEILTNNNYKILMPCENKTLGLEHYTKWRKYFLDNNINVELIKYYSDKPEQEEINSLKIFICQYDSLYKYELDFTHIVIDEYTNIRKRYYSLSILKSRAEKEQYLSTFFYTLTNAICIKCYDADLYNYDLEILNKYTNKQFKYYRLINYQQYNNNIVFTSHELLRNDIMNNIINNSNVSISCNIKDKCENIYDDIILTKPDIKIALLTKYGAKDNTELNKNYTTKLKDDLTTNTKLWGNYQVFIYSPTITTGISQNTEDNNEPHFYKHYSLFSSYSSDYTQSSQMCFRVRKLQTKTIMICDLNNKYDTLKPLTLNELKHNNELNECINKYNNSKLLYSKLECIELYDKFYKETQYYNMIFKTFKKWGCNNIITNFYNTKTIDNIKRKDINFNKTNLHRYTEFQNFINQKCYTNDRIITTNKNNNDILNVNKQMTLNKFNITHLLYNYYSLYDTYNYCIYNELVLNYSSSYAIYNKLKLLTFYPIKEVYYKMIELLDFTMLTSQDTINKLNDYVRQNKSFIIKLFCLSVLFCLFNNEKDYNKFMNDYVNNEPIKLRFRKIEITNKLKVVEKLRNYMIENKLIHDNENLTIIIYALSYFNIHLGDNSIYYDYENKCIYNNKHTKTIRILTNTINNVISKNLLDSEPKKQPTNYKLLNILYYNKNDIDKSIKELEELTSIEINLFNEIEIKGLIIENKLKLLDTTTPELKEDITIKINEYTDNLEMINDNINNRYILLNDIEILKEYKPEQDTPEQETPEQEIETIEETTKNNEKELKDKFINECVNSEFLDININVINQYKFRLSKNLYDTSNRKKQYIDMDNETEYIELENTKNVIKKNDYDIKTLTNDLIHSFINENIYEDLCDFICVEEQQYYRNKYNRLINLNFMPKIRLYNTYKCNKTNKYLINKFNLYYNDKNTNELELLLYECQNKITNIKVSEDTLNKTINNFIECINTDTNIINSSNNLLDSNTKPLENEELHNTYIHSNVNNIEEYIKVSKLGNVYKYVNNEYTGKFIPQIIEIECKNDRIRENFKYNDRLSNDNNESKYKKFNISYIIVNHDIVIIDRLITQLYNTNYDNTKAIKHINNDYTDNNNNNLVLVENWNTEHYKDIQDKIKEEKKQINKDKRIKVQNEKSKCNVCKQEYITKNKDKHIKTKKHIEYELNCKYKCNICDKGFKLIDILEHNNKPIHKKKLKDCKSNEEIVKWDEITKNMLLKKIQIKIKD